MQTSSLHTKLLSQSSMTAASGDLQDAQSAARHARDGDVEVAAKEFEALFATMLVKEMRRGLGDGFFGKGPGADVFEGWLDEHLGKSLAETGVMDLSNYLRVQLGGTERDEGAK